MRSPKNTLEGSRDLTVKEPVDNVDSRLSQTVALLVVAKMMSGLMELCCGLEDRCKVNGKLSCFCLLNVASRLCGSH